MLNSNSKKQLITLIGMPASGKSFIGKKLADSLEWAFIDLDLEIEKQEKKTIPMIFEDYGEDYFRKSEQKALQQVLKKQHLILATGGGTPCFFDNLKKMKEKSQCVFLAADKTKILERVLKKPKQRPLFGQISKEEIQGKINLMHKNRISFYQKADLIVKIADEKQILEEIIFFVKS